MNPHSILTEFDAWFAWEVRQSELMVNFGISRMHGVALGQWRNFGWERDGVTSAFCDNGWICTTTMYKVV